MVTPTTKTRQLRDETPTMLDAVRAEAPFASTLQASDSPSPDQVRVRSQATRRAQIRFHITPRRDHG
jgi:hypothetical protein